MSVSNVSSMSIVMYTAIEAAVEVEIGGDFSTGGVFRRWSWRKVIKEYWKVGSALRGRRARLTAEKKWAGVPIDVLVRFASDGGLVVFPLYEGDLERDTGTSREAENWRGLGTWDCVSGFGLRRQFGGKADLGTSAQVNLYNRL